MALEDFDGGNGTWLKLKHGFLCQESKTEKPGWKKIEGDFDGEHYVKWIRPYKGVSGYIDKIDRYEREFGGRKIRGWNITITDGDGRYILDIPFASIKLNSRWMKLAENIDYRKPVRISAWADKQNQGAMAINVQQDGVKVDQKYTREEPGGMPEPVHRLSGGWDYSEQEDFLIDRIIRFVIPNVELIAAERNSREPEKPARTVAEAAGLEPVEPEDSGDSEPIAAIRRSVKALAGTRITDNATEEQLLEEYFGTKDWEEIGKLPAGLLKAQAVKLDQMIPF